VLIDGRRANSCLALAVAHDDAEITTIEGLANGELHPLQQAFIDHDAFQCGYCTPGQICSAIGMLDEVRAEGVDLDDAVVRDRMSGNICRCGAYVNIIPAILDAAQ
jgi:xanthine dehydrogenase YagT iron-sulfur-binding subunit